MPLTAPRYVDLRSGGTLSNWVLPAGTEIGDALIVWGLASSFTVTDSRFTWHLPHAVESEEGGFWIGTADTLDPIAGTATSGTGVRSLNGRVMTFRGKVFTSRLRSVDGGSSLSYTVPSPGGGGGGAIALSLAWAGIGGPGACSFGGADSWAGIEANADYDGVSHSWTTAAPLSSGVTVTWGPAAAFITSASVLFMVGGFGDAPPCRNIKRGDRLDLGGARNYPPSKMQQTSSRGVGAY